MNVLEKAGRLIEQGWCQNDLANDGKFCALGAIAVAEFDADVNMLDVNGEYNRPYIAMIYEMLDHSPAVRALADEIIASGYTSFRDAIQTVLTWNDGQEDQQGVVNMFKSASERLSHSPDSTEEPQA